jgi:L-rhamnose mutarotase
MGERPSPNERSSPGTERRVAFLLRLRPGMSEAYDESHQHVWPEMLALLKRSGVSEYSIFRRDEMLVLVMCLPAGDDFDAVWDRIKADPVNTRWQQAMAPFLEPVAGLRPGERFPMLREVFYLP